jgi:uracil permease
MAYNPDEPIFEVQPQTTIKPIVGIDEIPKKWWETLFYGWQITLVDFTPFIWAGMFVSLAGLPETVIPTMIRACFLAMGVGTLVQTTLGNRLPIVQGPSSAVLTAMGGVTATYGFPAMWGAVFVGGLFEFFIGGSRILGKIKRFIPPVVTGSVVATIGFVAARIAITWIFTDKQPLYFILAIVSFILALVLKFKGKGMISRCFVLISVLVMGVAVSSILGVYDWGKVAKAPLFALPEIFPFRDVSASGMSSIVVFSLAAILGGFTGYIGSMFESIGDYAATCAVCDTVYTVKHVNRGIAAEGVGCVVSGFLGALPVTSYTQNIGILASTGIASRFVTQIAAVMFLLYGLSPKLAMMLACIPRAVVGSVFIISAGLIMFSGIDVLSSEKKSMGNNLVAGTTMGLAVMIPLYAATAGAAWIKGLHPFLQMYLTNNIFIAVTVGVLMNVFINMVLKPKNV